MDISIQQFCDQVLRSRALSQEQKELLVADPEALPSSYREEVAAILSAFDDQSMQREEYLRNAVEDRMRQFEKKLEEEGTDAPTTHALLKKAKALSASLFPVKLVV